MGRERTTPEDRRTKYDGTRRRHEMYRQLIHVYSESNGQFTVGEGCTSTLACARKWKRTEMESKKITLVYSRPEPETLVLTSKMFAMGESRYQAFVFGPSPYSHFPTGSLLVAVSGSGPSSTDCLQGPRPLCHHPHNLLGRHSTAKTTASTTSIAALHLPCIRPDSTSIHIHLCVDLALRILTLVSHVRTLCTGSNMLNCVTSIVSL